MIENVPRFPGAVLLTLVLAFLLTLIPLPEQYEVWRPEWFVLTFVHWALVIREKTSLVLLSKSYSGVSQCNFSATTHNCHSIHMIQ